MGMIRKGEIVAAMALSPQGQTLPFTCLARLDDREVVKCLAKCSSKRTGYGPPEIIREMVGTRAARILELEAPEPLLLELTLSARREVDERWALATETASCFGTLFMEGLDVLQPSLSPAQVPPGEAALVLALDLAALNSDRSRLNPNLALFDGRVAVFDFEHIIPVGAQSPSRLTALWSLAVLDLLEGHPLADRASPAAVAQCLPIVLPSLLAAAEEARGASPPAWGSLFDPCLWILAYTQSNCSALQELLLGGGL